MVTGDKHETESALKDGSKGPGSWEPKWDIYNLHLQQAWTDQQSSSDEFDKNLLTFSSGALGVSLAFIKDIVPLKDAWFLCELYLSWLSFVACIVVTLFSYALSIQCQKTHTSHLYKYYIEGKPEYLNKRSVWTFGVTLCAVLGAIFFLAGLASTVIFVIGNVSRLQR